MNLSELFKLMVEKEGSDLFLRANSIPRARIFGVVQELSSQVLNEKQIREIADHLLATDHRRRRFEQNLDIDFAHYEPGVGRFRVNVFTQRSTPVIVARHVHENIKNFSELNLPDELFKKFCEESNGLVLLCGPAGSGKSTAIASMLEYINQTSHKHVVTIEDPIEFIFQDKKSIFNQRQLGEDVLSYPMALKFVTQQSPDIIEIGNIRDEETMRATIAATELGAFVLSTFHTVNVVQTITRMVNFFPPYLHDEVRLQLSVILKGIVSLRLLSRKDQPGRIPAYETMVNTPTIARLIRENKINEIQQFIDEGELFGMRSFQRSLVDLVKKGIVAEEEARRVAISKDDFNLELKGVKRFAK